MFNFIIIHSNKKKNSCTSSSPFHLIWTIVVCLWVTDDIYSPDVYLYPQSKQSEWHLHKIKDMCSSVKSKSILSLSLYVSGKFTHTTDQIAKVVFQELQKRSVILCSGGHFTSPRSSQITPKSGRLQWLQHLHSDWVHQERLNSPIACQLAACSVHAQHRKSCRCEDFSSSRRRSERNKRKLDAFLYRFIGGHVEVQLIGETLQSWSFLPHHCH